MALIGILGYGARLVLFILALRHLGTARTGAYFSLALFPGANVAIVWLHDPFASSFAIDALLMAVGVWLHLTERHLHEHTHESVEHEPLRNHDAHYQHTLSSSDPLCRSHGRWDRHQPLRRSHPHYPRLHHRHDV